MIGKRSSQPSLYDVGNVYDLELPASSFFHQLASAGQMFSDEEFAEFYCLDNGRPSVPPSLLALLVIMQNHDQVSDAEAVERSAYDLRWCAVLRKHGGKALCSRSTVQLFRAHLVLHNRAKSIFVKSIAEAKRVGLLKGTALKVATDTKPVDGHGAVKDTYNLLATGIQILSHALAKQAGISSADFLKKNELDRYCESSVKGGADIDWSDKEARERFLTEIVSDARRLLSLAAGGGPDIKAAAELLSNLLLQDIEESSGNDGGAKIKQGTAPGRMPSATDPEVRHGRKSKSKRFTGHKASIVVDTETGVIVSADMIAGDAPDSTGVLHLIEEAEANTGLEVAEVLGDCAYGSGATRQEFEEAGKTLIAKVPQESPNGGLFRKSQFTIDLEADTATCPAGHTTNMAQWDGDRAVTFYFDEYCENCPLRAQCTKSVHGRSLAVHAQERMLQKAKEYQQTAEGKAKLKRRSLVENGLARLGHLGIGKARYNGRDKSRYQLLLASTVANLRRAWNWSASQTDLICVKPTAIAVTA